MIWTLLLLPLVHAIDPVCYLQHYGYMQGNAQTDDITSAVKRFQETFGLSGDGELNNETLEFMKKPRCGNIDELLPFVANPQDRWSNNTLRWFMYSNTQYDHIVERAFSVWAKYANLTFIRDIRSPNILISFSDKKHINYATQNNCFYDFDGSGGTLAHAYIPTLNYTKVDIHFDKEETWDFTMNLPDSRSTSFYIVLVHEIGHALGLHHSFVHGTVMYPAYGIPSGIADLYDYDLNSDDIKGIQYLYGEPSTASTTSSSTTSTTSSTTTSTTAKPREVDPITYIDICRIRHEIKTFFIVKHRLYAFYRQYVWRISLNKNQRTREEYTNPRVISDFLPFLPRRFDNISIYERSKEEIVMFVDRGIYYIHYPSLKLIRTKTLESFLSRRTDYIHVAVTDNNGRAYIVSQDWMVYGVDECKETVEILGYISDVFQGIPKGVTGAFKYINGRLYFKLNSTVLEYDEYTETVTRSFDDIFDVLGLFCKQETLVSKLYEILHYIR